MIGALLATVLAAEPVQLDLSIRGGPTLVGHHNSVVVDPARDAAPTRHAGSGFIHIRGPKRFDVLIPITLTAPRPRELPMCDPVPGDPDSCGPRQPAFVPLFTGESVQTPEWPRAGTYTVTLELGNREVGPVAFEVTEHPLAAFVVLPKGYEETVRSSDVFKHRGGPAVTTHPMLLVCAEKGSAEICVRVTEPLETGCYAGIPQQLRDSGEWTGEGVNAHLVSDRLQPTWAWCSGGRYLQVSWRFGSRRDIDKTRRRMFERVPSDGPAPR